MKLNYLLFYMSGRRQNMHIDKICKSVEEFPEYKKKATVIVEEYSEM